MSDDEFSQVLPDLEPEASLNKLEESIEGSEIPPNWPKIEPEEMEHQRDHEEAVHKAMGLYTPEPEIDWRPEKRYERQFPLKSWRPRRHTGLRRSSLS